jgi:putative endonuclease
VTANLSRRVWEHREGLGGDFTRRYGLKRLVYYERYEDIRDAIQRSHSISPVPGASSANAQTIAEAMLAA